MYVCVSEWKSALVLVRSFSISFGLSALFVFNCSILFLPLSTPSAHSLDLLLLLLLPFPRPIRHHWQFEALRGAAADAPEDAADAPEDAQESRRIHEVFRHWHYKVYVDGGKSSALCKMKYGSLQSSIYFEKIESKMGRQSRSWPPSGPRSVLSASSNRGRGSQQRGRGRNRQNLLVTPVFPPTKISLSRPRPYVEKRDRLYGLRHRPRRPIP